MSQENLEPTVYCIRNMISGRRYIGFTVDLRHRWDGHRHALNKGTHANPGLQSDWNTYGADAFTFDVLECSAETALTHDDETRWVEWARQQGDIYNIYAPPEVNPKVMRKTPLNVALVNIQREHGWTDAEMADEIGITRGGWNHIRLGRRAIGRAALRRILNRFPKLGHTTLFSLVSSVTETDECVTMPTHDSDRLAG